MYGIAFLNSRMSLIWKSFCGFCVERLQREVIMNGAKDAPQAQRNVVKIKLCHCVSLWT